MQPIGVGVFALTIVGVQASNIVLKIGIVPFAAFLKNSRRLCSSSLFFFFSIIKNDLVCLFPLKFGFKSSFDSLEDIVKFIR